MTQKELLGLILTAVALMMFSTGFVIALS